MRDLTCTCCGGKAGRFKQHWNQDTGYGICRNCLNWQVEKYGYNAETIKDYYGIEGVNYASPNGASK